MISKSKYLASVALLAACFATNASASLVVDTGTPTGGSGHFPYTLDSNDFYAGQITFSTNTQISSILTYLQGGTTGETFTVSLYDDSASLPGNQLYSAIATYGADGWNGLTNLSGWNVGIANYWVALEINGSNDLGSNSATGALLISGAHSPLAKTAFNSGSGYALNSTPLSFGLEVTTPESNVSPVPLPDTLTLMFSGLSLLTFVARRKKAQQ